MNQKSQIPITLKAPSSRTLSDYVADQLRHAILMGQFKPNQRLVEQDIAKSMKTSRGPVRDALKILENEGLVKREAHRGAYVTELSQNDVREIYTLREVLETLAIKFAIHNATETQIRELEEIIKSLGQAVYKDASYTKTTEIDLQFHHALCQISGHRRLLETWEALSPQIQLLLMKHAIWAPDIYKDEAVLWHQRIVEALQKKDLDFALDEMKKHMHRSIEWILESMERENDM